MMMVILLMLELCYIVIETIRVQSQIPVQCRVVLCMGADSTQWCKNSHT